MSPRLRVACAFLAGGLALTFITIFASFKALEPILHAAISTTPAAEAAEPALAALAAIYPFAGVNDVRALYGVVCLVPILLPLISGRRIAAWTVLGIGGITTLINLQDAVLTFLLAGDILFGLAFIASVGGPAAVGLTAAFAWARSPDEG